MKSLTGTVEECETSNPIPHAIVTGLKIRSLDHEKVLSMMMFGRHRINKGEMVKVHYETCSGEHWISHYDIFNVDGDVEYSGVAD